MNSLLFSCLRRLIKTPVKWPCFCFMRGIEVFNGRYPHQKGPGYDKFWRIEEVVHTRTWLCAILLLGACAEARKPDASKALQDIANKKVLLGWNEKISSSKFGLTANKNVDGKTLAQVVSSQFVGRDDGMLCSACHNSADSQGAYSVPSAKDAASPNLQPTDKVSNRTWVGPGGWAERFVKNPTKPENLKVFVQAWIDNGYK